MPITAADRAKFPGAEAGEGHAFANAITVAGVFIAVADGIAVAVRFTPSRRRFNSALAGIVHVDSSGGCNAGVGIGDSIAAAHRVKDPGAGPRAYSALANTITAGGVLGAVLDRIAVAVCFTAGRRLNPALTGIVHADAV